MKEVQKTDINPQTGKAYAINPASGQWDDNFWASQVDPVVNSAYKQASAQKAQQDNATTNYQAGIGSAVSSLQTQGTNLDTQYGSLLDTIRGQGTVAMNTITTGENNLLASRGITNNSPLYSAQMGSAQLPVTTAINSSIGSLGYTQAQLKNDLASKIATIQAGGAGTVAGLPLQYGSLALSNAANIAQIGLAGSQAASSGASARYIPIPGVGLWDTQTNQFTGGVTNNNMTTGGYSILNVK